MSDLCVESLPTDKVLAVYVLLYRVSLPILFSLQHSNNDRLWQYGPKNECWKASGHLLRNDWHPRLCFLSNEHGKDFCSILKMDLYQGLSMECSKKVEKRG